GDFHAKGDYFSEGQSVAGKWFGAGAEQLKLRGNVGLDEFAKLCRNVNPNSDELLTQRMKANRRVFYDFTLSPPKSVSIAALVGGNAHIERAHERATISALRELEGFAAARVRKNWASGYRTTGSMVAAVFRHDTSRALDPHLHCHCIIFNATFDGKEQQWKALETYEMLQVAKYAENVYYHELAQELRRLGYGIENNRRGDFEIGGVSPALIERFSKRHNEIDERTRQLLEKEPGKQGKNLKEIRERIAHDRRARKIKDIGRKRLTDLWNGQITNEEKAILAGLKQVPKAAKSRGGLKAAVAWAEEHLFDRRSVVNEFELWRYALEHGRGDNFSLKQLQKLTTQKSYVRNETLPGKVTTHRTLEREQRIVAAAQNGRNQFEPFNPNHPIQNACLDKEQRQAADKILASRDFVTLFRGGAGTGKSFTLKEVRQGLRQADHAVHIIAPQRQQVFDLQKGLNCSAATVSEFLTRGEMDSGAIIIVDEAGQIGAKQMLQLFEFVRQNGGRLILSGDTRQHGAVEASDALRAIEKFAGLDAVELTAIHRQNPELAKSREERRAIAEYKQAVAEARDGRLAASFDRLNRYGVITQCGLLEQQQLLSEKYVKLAVAGGSVVVISQTWSELHRLNEQIRDGMKLHGFIGHNDVAVTALVKLDLTEAQKRDERFYSEDSVVVFNQEAAGCKRGTRGQLIQTGQGEVFIKAAGKIRRLSFQHLDRISVCESRGMALAAGDRLQLKANATSANGK
ncbi:MAG: relaxase domain-containing protein, partial [Verrucomicrobia bacterium]|nr:relaxase domain-containing protein [Verrucomicrobiota bacterium]